MNRREISQKHGGSPVPFAPTVNGIVRCLCLDPQRNPKAPRAVLLGFGKGIERMRDQVIDQKGPFPTYLKRRSAVWEYVGDFRVVRDSMDKKDIVENYGHSKTPRTEISAVIWLERA